MINLYRAIWRHTGNQQILIIVLTLVVAALAAVPLDYQKQIINGMDEGADFALLLNLGLQMAAVILLSLSLKAVLGYRTQVVGESVIRFVRGIGVERSTEALGDDPDRVRSGTLANVISSESEAVGKFVGGSISEPLLQLGTLLSVIGYIAVMQPMLGLVALAMILPQVILVARTQDHINGLIRERVVVLRRSIESATGSALEQARQQVLADFDLLYENRRRIFLWKVSLKLVLGILNGAGLVVILVYGGWLVTEGRSDVGSIVAATVGLGRIQGPWKDLVAFFRNLSVVHVQYELLRDLGRSHDQAG